MPRQLVHGYIYEADTQFLNLETMEKLMEDSTKYGNWYTRQPWRAEVHYADGQWHFEQFDKGESTAKHSDPDIFSLINTVLELYGA